MAEPYLSEIRIMSFSFAPRGWATCNGQLMPINQNQALFSLMGTTYGGDGRVTFGLPDLQSRAPIHMGSRSTLGERGGEQAHTLSISEVPAHVHAVSASTTGADRTTPGGNVFATASAAVYGDGEDRVAMNPALISNTGGEQPHINMQPYLVLSFCIALQGIFPSSI
ncbi:MAG: tail fiber protein [Coriobacteriia bacterium]|nr:tail fiber protein [Coriobacteriia bacterium]